MPNILLSSSTDLYKSWANSALSWYILPFQKKSISGEILHTILNAETGHSSTLWFASLKSNNLEYIFSSYFSNALYRGCLNTSFIVAFQSLWAYATAKSCGVVYSVSIK